jgi:hypothetical protein
VTMEGNSLFQEANKGQNRSGTHSSSHTRFRSIHCLRVSNSFERTFQLNLPCSLRATTLHIWAAYGNLRTARAIGTIRRPLYARFTRRKCHATYPGRILKACFTRHRRLTSSHGSNGHGIKCQLGDSHWIHRDSRGESIDLVTNMGADGSCDCRVLEDS